MPKYVNPAKLKKQTFYNHAVVRAGTPVFLTGQVAWDEAGNVVGIGDPKAQIEQIWYNIGLILTDLNVGPEAIVKLVTYATSRDFIPALHDVRSKVFGDIPLPASTFVLVAGLAEEDILAEIDVTLILPS